MPARNLTALTFASLLTLAACAPLPPRPVPRAAPPPPPVNTQVYFYPQRGQSPEQQSRDRYECYLWAKQQTGFDPSGPGLAPRQRVVVQGGPPPGTGTAVGAITGAVIGSAVSSPRDAGAGAVVGAIAGAVVGTAADASRAQEAQAVQNRYDRRDAARYASVERQAGEYRRAMSACLEGRGYTVR